MWNQYYYFDLPKIRVGRARATKEIVAFALEHIYNIFTLWKLFSLAFDETV